MKISIFGMGYVGTVLMACLSENGHSVIGTDINPHKVSAINDGRSPIEEPGVDELIASGVADDRIRATTDAGDAVAETELSFLTVGTPLDDTGQLRTTSLYNVIDSAVPAIAEKDEHVFVIRSTVPPRTTRNLRSYFHRTFDGDTDVEFLVNPEFLREGTAMSDFYHPPYVVVGAFEESDGRLLLDLYNSLDVDADIKLVTPECAESIKLVNNAFHALKICFANEVGSFANSIDVDGSELMGLVSADTKLNISSTYLEPGLSFGGACLPKDTRAIASFGENEGIDVPLLETILESNRTHLSRVSEAVNHLDVDRVGIAGISFKSGTMDMRNSPGIRLAQSLDEAPLLYANAIDFSEIIGSNRDYLDKTFPSIESHVVENHQEFLDSVEAVVFTNDGSFSEFFPELTSKIVIDPVGAVRDHADEIGTYRPVVR